MPQKLNGAVNVFDVTMFREALHCGGAPPLWLQSTLSHDPRFSNEVEQRVAIEVRAAQRLSNVPDEFGQ